MKWQAALAGAAGSVAEFGRRRLFLIRLSRTAAVSPATWHCDGTSYIAKVLTKERTREFRRTVVIATGPQHYSVWPRSHRRRPLCWSVR